MSIRMAASIDDDGACARVGWDAVTKEDFRYYLFFGDIKFTIDDADFSTKEWRWVPVLDFALCAHAIVSSLEVHGEQVFEYTESEATITFQRPDESTVQVSASYVPDIAVVSYVELRAACASFLETMSAELLDRHPELGRNEHFRALLTKAFSD